MVKPLPTLPAYSHPLSTSQLWVCTIFSCTLHLLVPPSPTSTWSTPTSPSNLDLGIIYSQCLWLPQSGLDASFIFPWEPEHYPHRIVIVYLFVYPLPHTPYSVSSVRARSVHLFASSSWASGGSWVCWVNESLASPLPTPLSLPP